MVVNYVGNDGDDGGDDDYHIVKICVIRVFGLEDQCENSFLLWFGSYRNIPPVQIHNLPGQA